MAAILPLLVLLLLQAVSTIATTDISAYIRLVDGVPGRSGRLEILYDGEWGTVCDDGFDINNATLICHLLGYPDGGIPYCCATFGPGSGSIISNQIDCPPGTTDYNECSMNEVERNNCSHSDDVGVSCGPRIDPGPIRLVDGVSGRSGRLEIFHDNQWGTVCDDNFGTTEASAVCRQLGYQEGGVAACCATFGEGNDTIWAADIDCSPGASSLSQCVFPGWGTHSCSHKEDVGVSCSQNVTEGSVRLADGEPGRSGRLEIYHDDQWGTVCDDGFGLTEANVTCLQLGFQEGHHVSCCALVVPGSDPIWLNNVDCPPEATDLNQCSHAGWGNHTCSHYNDVVVTCGPLIPEGMLRLVDGVSSHSGRVEIFHDNKWGAVCFSNWNSANTICRQLGYPEGGTPHYFGRGSGPIWAAGVDCPSGANHLNRCTFSGWGLAKYSCHYSGVRCGSGLLEGSIRLVDGFPGRTGRLEILHDNTWGTICDDGFGTRNANTACQQLGFPDGGVQYCCATFGQGSGPIWADDVSCPEGAANLTECSFRGWGVHDCVHSEDVSLVCDPQPLDGPIRLAGGIPDRSGRLEVFHDNEWGTVCGNHFSLLHANVVCQQLGLVALASAHYGAAFGEGNGTIWADRIECLQYASNLSECTFPGWGVNNCTHEDDVGVTCQVLEGPIRLAGGVPGRTGRLEIYHNNQWGTVCDHGFSRDEANTVCRQLGFPEGGLAYSNAHFGQGFGPIWADDVNCPTGATNLTECSFRGWGVHNCGGHYGDVGVICDPQQFEGSIRLVDGVPERSGRLEIFHDNEWGTVCDDNFGSNEASAVCQALDLVGVVVSLATPHCCAEFGEANGTIWAGHIDCPTGSTNLSECTFPGWGVHNCTHGNDVGVSCQVLEGPLRLVDGVPGVSGRVEIFHGNQWGTFCQRYFESNEANAVCRQLGFSEGGTEFYNAHFGLGPDPVWVDYMNCPSAAENISQCTFSGWGVSSCSHYSDVGVMCDPQFFDGPIRLVDGVPGRSGRLEVFHDNEWGTVCDHRFGDFEANAVCQHLGFAGVAVPRYNTTFGEGNGTIWADGIVCPNGASDFSNCLFPGWGVHNCTHEEDVGVSCDVLEGSIRLEDGIPGFSGRLEILHGGQWGTVCDDYFYETEASTVCRQLGFPEGGVVHHFAYFGPGSGPIWADDVNCPTGATNLTECSFRGWGVHNCIHYEDVGVRCLSGGTVAAWPVTATSTTTTDTTTMDITTMDTTTMDITTMDTTTMDTTTMDITTMDTTTMATTTMDITTMDTTTMATTTMDTTKMDTTTMVTTTMDITTMDTTTMDTTSMATTTMDITTMDTTKMATKTMDITKMDTTTMDTTTMDTTTIDTTTGFPDYTTSSQTDTPMCGNGICGHICNSTNSDYTCSCYDGSILEMNNATCRDPCPAGTSVTGDTCVPCPHGQYQQYREKPQCDSCPKGYNTSDTGSTEFSQCRTLCDLSSGECENGGRCVDDGGRPSCDCGETGFIGQTCVTDIDECLPKPCQHGGQCTNTPGGYECQCLKAAGNTYAGVNCSNLVNREPEALDVTPLFGPVAGGTNITVLGNNFDAGFQPLRLRLQGDKYACPVWQSNGTYLVATTPRGEDPDVDVPLSIEVVFEGGLTISTRKSFKYRVNPEITSLYPNNTLLDGGSTITVDGQGLMSVDTPYLEITMEINTTIHETFNVIIETIRKYFRERCFVLTNERVECLTPAVVIPESFNASDEQSTLALYAGFILDGYEKYRNLQNTSLESSRTLGYVRSHNMTPRTEVFVYKGQPLILQGARIDPDAEYSVLIGQGECLITDTTSTSIHCDVPKEAPPKLPFSMSKYHTITLNILRSVNYTMGEVQYPPEEGLLVGLPVAAAVILTLAIVVSVAMVVTRTKKKAAQRKTAKRMEEWIVLPAPPSDIADSTSSDDPVPMQIDYIRLQRERGRELRLQRHLQAMQQDWSWKATS